MKSQHWYLRLPGENIQRYYGPGNFLVWWGPSDDPEEADTDILEPRMMVGIGVEEISERGGEEEILTHAEVMRQFGKMVKGTVR